MKLARRSLHAAILAVLCLTTLDCASVERPQGRLSTREGKGSVYRVDLDDSGAGDRVDRLRSTLAGNGERLYLWIDVGRSPKLAREHPEWVAGIGSHEDWRRLRPEAPTPKPGERVGVFPWTPIWYKAVLENRREAVVRLLRGRTAGVAGVFLTHVQGAPSACGCGNDQCRWTVDYRTEGGPEQVESPPATLLLKALRDDLPGVAWIPVLTTECEEHDLPGEGSTGYCGKVGCFTGACWKESTLELESILGGTRGPIGLLAGERAFGRKLGRYAKGGGWTASAARSLEEIPPRHNRAPLLTERLIVVVEDDASARALPESLASRVEGLLEGESLFDESWEPRIVPALPGGKAAGRAADDPATHGHD